MGTLGKLKPKKTKRFYICDPSKNTKCEGNGKKGWCGKMCFCTTKYQFAVDGAMPLTKGEYAKEAVQRMGD